MSDAMSGQQPRHWCPEAVQEANLALDEALRSRFKVGLKLWKISKSVVDLATLGLAAYALRLGADPGFVMGLTAVSISGPEVLEWVAVRKDLKNPDDGPDDPDDPDE